MFVELRVFDGEHSIFDGVGHRRQRHWVTIFGGMQRGDQRAVNCKYLRTNRIVLKLRNVDSAIATLDGGSDSGNRGNENCHRHSDDDSPAENRGPELNQLLHAKPNSTGV